MSDPQRRAVLAAWQAQLAQHMANAGSSDPALLSQLPALRSPAVARPGQIIVELGWHPVPDKQKHVATLAKKGTAYLDGEVSGTLEQSFARLTSFFDQETNRAVKSMVAAFGPLIVLILGIIFGPLALMALYVLPKGNKISDKGRGAVPGTPGTKKDPRADLYEVPNKKKHH